MNYEEILKVLKHKHTSFATSMFQIQSLSGMMVQQMGEYTVNEFAFGINLDRDMEERIGYSNYVEIELQNIVSMNVAQPGGSAYKIYSIVVK
jgi:hypothetical protein